MLVGCGCVFVRSECAYVCECRGVGVCIRVSVNMSECVNVDGVGVCVHVSVNV